MNGILEKISNAKHVAIVVDKESLFVASALYTYVLTLHKKVSLVCKDKELSYKFLFLPWFDKIKSTDTPAADLSIELNISGVDLFYLFKNFNIQINKKMAIALYGAIINETNGFEKNISDGTIFAVSSELINLGAEHKLAFNHIRNHSSLSRLRLHSLMFAKMVLENDAKVALFFINEKDLQSSGADIEVAKELILDAFKLPFVEALVLLDSMQDNEVIKIINKER